MESPALDGTLFILARLLEFANIGVIILFASKNVPARYIYYVLGITVFSILFFVVSLFIKGLALTLSLVITLFAFALMLAIAVKVLRAPVADIDVPESTRCPVCSAFVKRTEGMVALQAGSSYLFFDSEEHLKRFLEEFEEYVRIRRLNVQRESLGRAFMFTRGRWEILNL